MSTFKGFVEEFPDIRIDYFRKIPDRTPPLACFLSHVHSDHLQGLESLRSPFVYCSAGTRELLLRLEKYPHRMNFSKGILESRRVHYKHLKSLLKPIPLHTPTEIELTPGQMLRVTLFDANHCSGAVMFLIENSAKAVLYTGDIRSEAWWVNSLIRNPILLPYASGTRRMDKIYLDTTFAVKRNPYRRFPTKADGLRELLVKVAAYPEHTVFHFNAWTFGYEEVWIALASALRSKIHVDPYKMRLYKGLNGTPEHRNVPQEGPSLCGFMCGNRYQPGCLTDDQTVRLHSCEHGTSCTKLETLDVVWITPIITRVMGGSKIPEVGAGGGGEDLLEAHELDLNDTLATMELIKLCSETIADPQARLRTLSLIADGVTSSSKVVSLDTLDLPECLENMPLVDVARLLQHIAESGRSSARRPEDLSISSKESEVRKGKELDRSAQVLPRRIDFPYSRHSSYDELCHLVEVFKPMDIYPCTVDKENWTEAVSMESLFGQLCSSKTFMHDQEMKAFKKNQGTLRETSSPSKATYEDAAELPSSQSTEITDGDKSKQSIEQVSEVVDQMMFGRRYSRHHSVKRPRLSSATEDMLQKSKPTEMATILDTSTDNSLGRRIQAIKKSFDEEHNTDSLYSVSSSAYTTSALGIDKTPANSPTSGSDAPYETALDDMESKRSDGEDTQLSLPDSAFDSQQTRSGELVDSKVKIQYRKEAYKAAKSFDGREWAAYRPISSNPSYLEEELG